MIFVSDCELNKMLDCSSYLKNQLLLRNFIIYLIDSQSPSHTDIQ